MIPENYLNKFLPIKKAKPKKKSPEKNFRVALKKKLESLGCIVISTTMKAKIGSQFVSPFEKGTADLIVCSPKGLYFEIETKSNTGKPTDSQIHRKDKFSKRGLNNYLFCNPQNEKDVIAIVIN